MDKINKCPLCGSRKIKYFYSGIDKYFSQKEISFSICDNCSLVFLNPRPSEEEYDKMYKNVFQDKRRGLKNVNDAILRLKNKQSYKNKTNELKYFVNYVKENDKCLEIGSGWGALAKVLSDELECSVEGIEPSVLASETAKKYYGLNIFNGNFDEFYLQNKNKKYNFIYSYHVFEHILNPNEFLQKTKNILKNNAKLLLALPNITNPDYPYEKFFHIEHVFYYSTNTLKMILEKNGFQVLKLWKCDRDIKVICQRNDEISISNFSNNEEQKIRLILFLYNFKYKFLRIAKIIFLFFIPLKYKKTVISFFANFFKKIKLIKT